MFLSLSPPCCVLHFHLIFLYLFLASSFVKMSNRRYFYYAVRSNKYFWDITTAKQAQYISYVPQDGRFATLYYWRIYVTRLYCEESASLFLICLGIIFYTYFFILILCAKKKNKRIENDMRYSKIFRSLSITAQADRLNTCYNSQLLQVLFFKSHFFNIIKLEKLTIIRVLEIMIVILQHLIKQQLIVIVEQNQ